jgi:predicted small lipoprotein YifL
MRWTLLAVAGIALALSGCGRKGPLDPPSAAVVTTGQQQGQAVQTTQTATKPDRPFVLDPLLDRRQ